MNQKSHIAILWLPEGVFRRVTICDISTWIAKTIIQAKEASVLPGVDVFYVDATSLEFGQEYRLTQSLFPVGLSPDRSREADFLKGHKR